jgi:hypothetical protein
MLHWSKEPQQAGVARFLLKYACEKAGVPLDAIPPLGEFRPMILDRFFRIQEAQYRAAAIAHGRHDWANLTPPVLIAETIHGCRVLVQNSRRVVRAIYAAHHKHHPEQGTAHFERYSARAEELAMDAAQRFDPSRGASFSTFFHKSLRGWAIRALADIEPLAQDILALESKATVRRFRSHDPETKQPFKLADDNDGIIGTPAAAPHLHADLLDRTLLEGKPDDKPRKDEDAAVLRLRQKRVVRPLPPDHPPGVKPVWQYAESEYDLPIREICESGDVGGFLAKAVSECRFSNRDQVIADNLINPTREWRHIAAEFAVSKPRLSQLKTQIQSKLRAAAEKLVRGAALTDGLAGDNR